MDKNYITLKELAKELNVHFNTAYRYVQEGKIKSILIGNKYRISIDEVERIKNDGIKYSKE